MNNRLKFFFFSFFLICVMASSIGLVFSHDDPNDPDHVHTYPSVVTTEDTQKSTSNQDSGSKKSGGNHNSNSNPNSSSNPNSPSGQNSVDNSNSNSLNDTENNINITNDTNSEGFVFSTTSILIAVAIVLFITLLGIIIYKYKH